MEENCNKKESKVLAILFVPETPFEKGISIYTHQQKRNENAQKILDNLKENVENGTAIIIKP